jgi:hypothetical protein
VNYFFERKKGLLIWGDVKTGKTASVVALGKEALRRGFSVYYFHSYDYQQAKDDISPYLFEEVDFLIIDDFDFIVHSALEHLKNVLKKRVTLGKINFLTMKDKDYIFKVGFDFLKEHLIPIRLEKVVDGEQVMKLKEQKTKEHGTNNHVRKANT